MAEMDLMDDVFVIPELLEQATFKNMEVAKGFSWVEFHWTSPRLGPDGERADDQIRVRLEEIATVAVGIEAADPFARPSKLPAPGRIVKEKLIGTTEPALEQFSISSHFAEMELKGALEQKTIHGNEERLWDCPLLVCFHVSGEDLGLDDPFAGLVAIACDRVSIWSGDGPLDIEQWAQDLLAFHEAEEQAFAASEEAEGDASRLDPAVVLADDELQALLSYQPPQEPAFVLDQDPEQLPPEELLRPLRLRFEGQLSQDWSAMAQAYAMEEDWDEVAEGFADWYQTEGWGSWTYVRAVDGWWCEGGRAMVQLRGMEHQAPEAEVSAENIETVWFIALREWEGQWRIEKEVQGWPAYESAPTLPDEEKPWLAEW